MIFFRKKYASMLETFLAFFILLLVCFGVMQLYKLSLANMVSKYAAFRGTRSSAVGFTDYLVDRETRVKTIPVSGDLVEPESSVDIASPYTQFYAEKVFIEEYMSGIRWINYTLWGASPVRHTNYKCKNYGQPLLSGTCSVCSIHANTSLGISQRISGDTTKVSVFFNDYPLDMPLYRAFFDSGRINISKSAEMTNHANVFLDE